MTPLQVEILRLGAKEGICDEARALILAAGALDSGAKTLPQIIEMLQAPDLSDGFNIPSEMGEKMGRELVRLSGGSPPACCSSCAFRLGSVPNRSLSTVYTAMECAMDGTEFLCHTDGEACKGWLHSQKGKGQ